MLVLDALGIGPGDEVICPAFTFYATAESIARRGATPVFADIDPATYNLDPEDVAARITPRTRAIMPVHLFGRPAPLEELAALGLPLIEDAAQAFGAPGIAQHRHRVDVQLLSDEEPLRARRRRADRRQRRGARASACGCCASTARKAKVDFELVGYNSRLDEIHAAALRIFLPHLDEWTVLRREAAERYRELGLGDVVTTPEDEPGHVYHLFVSRSSERDRIVEALREAEIGCATYYLPPLHLQPALSYLGYEEGSLPETEKLARENFSVPLWAGDRVRAAGARRRSRARRRRRAGRMTLPISRHRILNLLADAVLIARRVAAHVLDPLRPVDSAVLQAPAHRGRSFASCVGDQARGLRPLRLLQPLVALRLDAGHVGRRARRRRRVAARRPGAVRVPAGRTRRGCRAGSR